MSSPSGENEKCLTRVLLIARAKDLQAVENLLSLFLCPPVEFSFLTVFISVWAHRR